MKKLLLTLGASAIIVAPVMALLSCSDKKDNEEDKKSLNAFKLRKSNI